MKLPIKLENTITTGMKDLASTPSLFLLKPSNATIEPARSTHKQERMMIWVWATNVEIGVGDCNRFKLNIWVQYATAETG